MTKPSAEMIFFPCGLSSSRLNRLISKSVRRVCVYHYIYIPVEVSYIYTRPRWRNLLALLAARCVRINRRAHWHHHHSLSSLSPESLGKKIIARVSRVFVVNGEGLFAAAPREAYRKFMNESFSTTPTLTSFTCRRGFRIIMAFRAKPSLALYDFYLEKKKSPLTHFSSFILIIILPN